MSLLRELIEASKSKDSALVTRFQANLKKAGHKDDTIKFLTASLLKLEKGRPLKQIPFLSTVISALLGNGYVGSYPVMVVSREGKTLKVDWVDKANRTPEFYKSLVTKDPVAQKGPWKTQANKIANSPDLPWDKSPRVVRPTRWKYVVRILEGFKIKLQKGRAESSYEPEAPEGYLPYKSTFPRKDFVGVRIVPKSPEFPAGKEYFLKPGATRREIDKPIDPGKSPMGKALLTPKTPSPMVGYQEPITRESASKAVHEIWSESPNTTFMSIMDMSKAKKRKGALTFIDVYKDFFYSGSEGRNRLDFMKQVNPSHKVYKDLETWLLFGKDKVRDAKGMAVAIANAAGRNVKDYSVVSAPYHAALRKQGNALMVVVGQGPFDLEPDSTVWLGKEIDPPVRGARGEREKEMKRLLKLVGKKINLVGRKKDREAAPYDRSLGFKREREELHPVRNLANYYTNNVGWKDVRSEIKHRIKVYEKAIFGRASNKVLEGHLATLDDLSKQLLATLKNDREDIMRRYADDDDTVRSKAIHSLISVWRGAASLFLLIYDTMNDIVNPELKASFAPKAAMALKYGEEAKNKLDAIVAYANKKGSSPFMKTAVKSAQLVKGE